MEADNTSWFSSLYMIEINRSNFKRYPRPLFHFVITGHYYITPG
ncbi:hypothetical protein EDO6_05170 [Paenibacillus xylanexedens]|nr:hypothetical protein EDO6_05170 [Paenibacillus xylanexedens]